MKNKIMFTEKLITCKKCKEKVRFSSNFCSNCGKILPPNYLNISKTSYLYWVSKHLLNKLKLIFKKKLT